MFWTLYIVSVFFFCYLLSRGKETKLINRKSISIIICILLLTPTQIQVGSNDFAPAIPTFFLNLIFEQNYSLRVLRPLILSFIISLLFMWFFRLLKRRFF